MQGIKSHQEAISSNLKSEIRDEIMETLQDFLLSSNNQENIDPNSETSIATNHRFCYSPRYNYPVGSRYLQHVDTNSVNQVSNASSFEELLKEMQAMKATINTLTLTNQ